MNANKANWSGWVAVVALALGGCAGTAGELDLPSEQLTGADETQGIIESALSSTVADGATVQTTANLNLRTGPSTSHSILRVMPQGSTVTVIDGSPTAGWYHLKHNGVVGWSAGGYLKLVSTGASSATVPVAAVNGDARDGAIARARSGVGFSYWWGHGRWQGQGPSSSTRGYCAGSCPNCTHSGGNGADCSGYLAKVWQVPSTNDELSVDSHPYSTWNFNNSSIAWHTVSRSSIRRGDAMVYNSNGAGHTFLYESGDGWGSMWAYEAKGCAAGIVHNLRTASSAYKAIARNGY